MKLMLIQMLTSVHKEHINAALTLSVTTPKDRTIVNVNLDIQDTKGPAQVMKWWLTGENVGRDRLLYSMVSMQCYKNVTDIITSK